MGLQPHERVHARNGPTQVAEKLDFAPGSERAWLYRLRKNSILPPLLKGHGFSRADKVNQINVGFSHRGTYFVTFREMQPFSAAYLAPVG